jgi:DNA-binding NarL/FixJ family response regulator
MTDEGAQARSSDDIRVMICDDHALFRRGLIMVLEAEDDIDVVAEAEDGEDAVEKAVEFVPDVVLMDVRMPGVDGIEATRRIAEKVPTAKILMLTVSDEEEDLYEAIKAGATGYLLKEVSIEEVAPAARAVVAGQSLISPSMASKLLGEFSNPRPGSPTASSRCCASSPRASPTARSPATCSSRRTPSRTTSATSSRSCTCTPAWKRSCTRCARSSSTSPAPTRRSERAGGAYPPAAPMSRSR